MIRRLDRCTRRWCVTVQEPTTLRTLTSERYGELGVARLGVQVTINVRVDRYSWAVMGSHGQSRAVIGREPLSP